MLPWDSIKFYIIDAYFNNTQQYLQNYLEVILTIEKYQSNYVPRVFARCQHNMHKDRQNQRPLITKVFNFLCSHTLHLLLLLQ